MIGMRATRYHFFLDLICQNYFAQSGLVKECLSASQQSDIAKTNILFNLYHLPFFCGDRRKSNYNYISIKTTNPIFLTFFSNFLFFCISSTEQFIVWHLFIIQKQAFRVVLSIIIQLSSASIFLGLWSRGPPCNFTEQLFLHN